MNNDLTNLIFEFDINYFLINLNAADLTHWLCSNDNDFILTKQNLLLYWYLKQDAWDNSWNRGFWNKFQTISLTQIDCFGEPFYFMQLYYKIG